MKKLVTFIVALTCLISLSSIAGATTYEFQPYYEETQYVDGNPYDLNDLDHYYNYTWEMGLDLPENEVITGATLFFDDIRNWDWNTNDLYVHLLDDADLGLANPNDLGNGITSYYDGQAGGDNFAGMGELLNHWHNLPATAQDITYTFDADEILAFNSYVADGIFALAFDADCHYWNNGITLVVETEVIPPNVPEPGTLLLLGSGLLGLLGLGRKRFGK